MAGTPTESDRLRAAIAVRDWAIKKIYVDARSRLWTPVVMSYLVGQVIYGIFWESVPVVRSGVLAPVFFAVAGGLYWWGLNRLDPYSRFIYREWVRYHRDSKWWPSIMALLSGIVLLPVSLVTVGEARSDWVTPVFLMVSLALCFVGGAGLARRIAARYRARGKT